MGNKPARKMGQQPYNQMVEDAIAALKDRPGSTQSDIFQYLEAKYEKKISPKNKKNLETVIRSVIKTKARGAGGRPPMRGFGRRGGGLKGKGGPRRKFGRGLPRGKIRNMSRSLNPKLKKTIPKPHMTTLKPGKKSLVMSGGHQRQQLLRRAKRGTTMRGSKLLLRPVRRTSSVGSMSMSLPSRRGRRN
ncbi:hypothetical protein KC19_4G097200 [Ceratodon purpureus]|uniref:H15 domain-containing protein n=1 Tax=Ceratodon purpureus TaxID=3225 RepID=A0A8T0IAA0_CERPU|nr:hypothetical protein KC19_4G096400 [Ceratodon purpureus]KAG0579418.1 hypothetical protein KC19_4G097200 [Ceratodon purpureus]